MELAKNLFRILLIFFSLMVLSFSASAAPPRYGYGTASPNKIEYCTNMVKRYGHLSKQLNDDYYGIGVQRPVSGNWKMRIKEPWFSSELYIVFEQVTKEKYEDYKHTVYCHWIKKGDKFEFVIGHHHFRAAPFCYRRMTDLRTDDRFFFNPTLCP